MPDLAISEMLVLLVILIVVVGPKDLPKVMRAFGKVMGKVRALASEFQGGLDQLTRESELEELRQKYQKYQRINPRKELERMVDPTTGEETKAKTRAEKSAPGQGTPESGSSEAAGGEASQQPHATQREAPAERMEPVASRSEETAAKVKSKA